MESRQRRSLAAPVRYRKVTLLEIVPGAEALPRVAFTLQLMRVVCPCWIRLLGRTLDGAETCMNSVANARNEFSHVIDAFVDASIY
eukprot:5292372-Lingulodinium_polyedra.AAC.1